MARRLRNGSAIMQFPTAELQIKNLVGGQVWSVAQSTDSSWTLTGTMTIGATANLARKFFITLTSLTAAIIQSVGTITYGAK
jgi:hypothetical protein